MSETTQYRLHMTCGCVQGVDGIVTVCPVHQQLVNAVVRHAAESVKPDIDKLKAERDELRARLEAIESDRNPGDRFDV